MKNGEQPSYPTQSLNELSGNVESFSGLTKREYFAAMAMHGLLSNSKLWSNLEAHEDTGYKEWFAKQSIEYADELLKQLEK